MAHTKIGRNDPCHCGSRKKYKQCCEAKTRAAAGGSRLLLIAVAGIMLAAIYFTISAMRHDSSSVAGAGKVWSPEHGHYH